MKFFVFLCFFFQVGKFVAQKQESVKQSNTSYFLNLHKLNDSIFRGELPTKIGAKELEKLGVHSFLNLRFFRSDKCLTKGTNISLYNEHVNAWVMSEGEVIEALKIIQKAPKPILIHCVHGSDRTGTVIAAYRIVFEGWTKEAAIEELLNPIYGFHPCFQNLIYLIRHLDVEKIKRELNVV